MRIAHINVISELSTGGVAKGIGEVAKRMGHSVLLCHARGVTPDGMPSYRVGNRLDTLAHGVFARLTDRAGFASRRATKALVRQLEAYKPDVVHLHNLHGYYLHLPTLFAYLKRADVPVVWTLHDCWAYTGHCAYYSMAKCDRWQRGCGHCPEKRAYPASLLMDQSARNWLDKRRLFCSLPDVTLVAPSLWLKREVERSFLRKYPVELIPSGIDLTAFRPCEDEGLLRDVIRRFSLGKLGGRKLLLSVASTWEPRKGLDDFIRLNELLPEDEALVLVGLTDRQRQELPDGILALPRVRNASELRALYSAADVYLSLSHDETQGLSLLEALACGTQCLCYNATALPELLTPDCGEVAEEYDVEAVAAACARLCEHPKSPADCRRRTERYDKHARFAQYVRLYEALAERPNM